MEPTQELIDALFVDKVVAARRRTMEQKFLAGGQLFDSVIERMKGGILMENPKATDAEIRHQLERRLLISRILEQRHECE